MPIVISVPDALRQSVEAATGGRNTVLYDSKGYPSVMVEIPKFNIEDVLTDAGSGPHPAFVVNGAVKNSIFIGKYQAIVHDGHALSLPGQDPAVNIDFDTAKARCEAKGTGWHLMTNAEWAAIALWCWKQGFLPRGNNDATWTGSTYVDPKDVSAPWERGVKATTGSDGRSKTGSGPASWYHDNTMAGIADLNGNVWEWVGGMRLNGGEIQVIQDNNAAVTGTDQSPISALWKAIKQDGSLVAPGTAGTLKYDATAANGTGAAELDDVIDFQSDGSGYTYNDFEALTADAGITVPNLLKHLALFPPGAGLGGDGLWTRNQDERLPLRGGGWDRGAQSGVFALTLTDPRSGAGSSVGFRPAFVL